MAVKASQTAYTLGVSIDTPVASVVCAFADSTDLRTLFTARIRDDSADATENGFRRLISDVYFALGALEAVIPPRCVIALPTPVLYRSSRIVTPGGGEFVSSNQAALECFLSSEAGTDPVSVVTVEIGESNGCVTAWRREGDRDGRTTYRATRTRSVEDLSARQFDEFVLPLITQADPAIEALHDGTATLLESVRRALAALTHVEAIEIPLSDQAGTFTLTRDDVERVTTGYVDVLTHTLAEVIHELTNADPADERTVLVLTGRPAAYPHLRNQLTPFGTVADIGDPDTIVARGAGLLAARLQFATGSSDPSGALAITDGYLYVGATSQPRIFADHSIASFALERGDSEAAVAAVARILSALPEQAVDDLRREERIRDLAPADSWREEPSTATFEPSPLDRRLTAEISCEGRPCERVLTPQREHTLEVRIAVPDPNNRAAVAADAPFPDAELPADEWPLARLIVDVWSDDSSVRGSAPIDLPMTNRRAPSTTAVFRFTAPDDGSLVRLHITVLFRGRPLQAAVLSASARHPPARGDSLQLFAIPLSAPAEPSATVTAADATLELTDNALRRLHTPDNLAVWVPNAADIAASFEELASRTLGVEDSPSGLADARARGMLVGLARRGSELRRLLADLDLGDANIVAMKVSYNAAVLPLELAYDGDAPDDTATICDCVGSSALSSRLSRQHHASSDVVCPYAFWGLSRVIARVVMGRPVLHGLPSRPAISPLSLRPVLYGAANKADRRTEDEAAPSDILASALRTQFGQNNFQRVSTWLAWCRAVEQSSPELLVVLGHTEMSNGEPSLVIGRNSALRQASVALKHLGVVDKPAPLILLFACSSAISGTVFGSLPGTFMDRGAAAVIATLTRLRGPHAAAAAVAVVSAMDASSLTGLKLGEALTAARRQLIGQGLLVGLFLVAHGEIDILLQQHN